METYPTYPTLFTLTLSPPTFREPRPSLHTPSHANLPPPPPLAALPTPPSLLALIWLCDENGISSRVSTIAATPRQRRRRALPPGSRGPSPRSHRGAPNLLHHRLLISRVKTHGESLLKISIPSLCFVFCISFNTESESIKLGL